MARPSSKDPLDKFRWAVTIDDFVRLGFSSCETPSISVNTQSYPEGGSHLWPRKIIDSVEYKPVTLQRGVTSNLDFHRWATQFMELIQGARDTGNATPTFIPPGEYRKTIKIDHLDRTGTIVKSYILYNAFPIEYKPASDFASDSDDTISMEKLVLTYESFEVKINPNNKGTDPNDIRGITKRLIGRF